MRNNWLALILCILPLHAAEKNRDWQSGKVVESKALTSPQDHAIAAADKIYLVRGAVANEDETLAVGATVRFAVEDKNLFLSISGKEYKLYVLGVRASMAKAAPSAPVAAVAPAPNTAPVVPAPVAPGPVSATSPPVPAAAIAAPRAPAAPAPAPLAVAPPVVAVTPAAAAPVKAPSASVVLPPAPAPALDNDAVVRMIVGGLKEDTVVSVIQARPGKYALGSDALAGLRAAGVPQSVIAAMTAKMQPQR